MERIQALPDGTRLLILGPLVKDRKTEGERVFEAARRQGFVRVRVDRELRDLDDVQTLDKYKRHTIEVVVDRLVVHHADDEGRPYDRDHPNPDGARLADSVETALRLGEGVMVVAPADADAFEELHYSEHYTCPYDGTQIEDLEPRSFSFNSPHGACPTCTGLGIRLEIDPQRVVPDRSLSIAQGALMRPFARMPMADSWYGKVTEAVARAHGWDPTVPLDKLPPAALEHLLWAPRGEQVRHQLPPRPRRQQLRRHVRGPHPQPGAALQGDRLGVRQVRAGTLHGRAAVPGLRRQAAQAGGPRGDRGGPGHLGRRRPRRERGDGLGGQPARAAHGARADDRPAGAQGDHAPAWASWSTWAWTT